MDWLKDVSLLGSKVGLQSDRYADRVTMKVRDGRKTSLRFETWIEKRRLITLLLNTLIKFIIYDL